MICGWTTFPPMGAEFPWTLTSSLQTPSMSPTVQERLFLSAFEKQTINRKAKMLQPVYLNIGARVSNRSLALDRCNLTCEIRRFIDLDQVHGLFIFSIVLL